MQIIKNQSKEITIKFKTDANGIIRSSGLSEAIFRHEELKHFTCYDMVNLFYDMLMSIIMTVTCHVLHQKIKDEERMETYNEIMEHAKHRHDTYLKHSVEVFRLTKALVDEGIPVVEAAKRVTKSLNESESMGKGTFDFSE